MPDASSLKGKTAWITGGGSGIGLAGGIELARSRRARGDLRPQRTTRSPPRRRQIKALGSCEAIALDVGNKQAVAKAAERIGRVDILVNSAGINDPKRNFFNVSIDGLGPDRRDQPLGHVLLRARGAARDAQPQGRPDHQRLVVGGALSEHAHRAGLQRHQARRRRAHRVDQHGGGRRTASAPRPILPGEVATPILEKRPVPPPPEVRAKMLQAEDLGRTIAFVASLPPRACINEIIISPTLEPLLPRRPGIAQKLETQTLIFWRVALPFLAGYYCLVRVPRGECGARADCSRPSSASRAAGLGLLSGDVLLFLRPVPDAARRAARPFRAAARQRDAASARRRRGAAVRAGELASRRWCWRAR